MIFYLQGEKIMKEIGDLQRKVSQLNPRPAATNLGKMELYKFFFLILTEDKFFVLEKYNVGKWSSAS